MSFFSRLTSGLSKTSAGISEGISSIFTKSKLDDAMLEELEELLITADMGAATAASIVAEFGKERFDKDISADEAKEALAQVIAARLEKVAVALTPSLTLPLEGEGIIDCSLSLQGEGGGEGDKPCVILMIGVNGNGKTTTAGKLAAQFKTQGKRVLLAAADTFRAAAVEQLKVWGTRAGCEVITGAPNADPASVAYAAVEKAQSDAADVLMIDTAGRLQNKQNLMAELEKIIKVIRKVDESAPHHIILVLDATTGQNALSQVKAFSEVTQVTGLVVTKLDGTAKAGVVVALAEQYGLPIHAIGVGEGVDDLQAFDPLDFARNLVGASTQFN